MTQRESRLSRQIMEAIRARGHFCFKVHGSEHMMAGLPDIIVCVEGVFVGLETKLPESRDNVSPRQRFVHEQIRAAEGRVDVVCSVDEAVQVIVAMENYARFAKKSRSIVTKALVRQRQKRS